MEAPTILPVLDTIELQKKANEYAMKGTTDAIKEFYTGYDSPYKKAITSELKKQEIGFPLDLPDIISVLQDSLVKELEVISHTAIYQTYVPMIKQMLVRSEKEINFSKILEEFIEINQYESEDQDDYTCEIEKSSHGWLDVHLGCKDKNYELTLHLNSEFKDKEIKKYHLLSFPRDYGKYPRTMQVKIDGAVIEMPFSQNVLQDKFIAYLTTLLIADSNITMNCDGFSEEMFPEKCHC